MEEGVEKLKVYQLAHELALQVHRMSLDLPYLELHEEGGQIRRSSKSVSSNIVEGYALRKYKNEFIRYLYRSFASAKETVEHLRYLFETGSMTDKGLYNDLLKKYDELHRMLFTFIDSVNQIHNTPRQARESRSDKRIRHLTSAI